VGGAHVVQGWAFCGIAPLSLLAVSVIPAALLPITTQTLGVQLLLQIRPLEELYKFGHFFR
jgi:hypothetical protein